MGNESVESVRHSGASTSSRPGQFGLSTLRLSQKPKPRFLHQVKRDIHSISPALREKIRGLTGGEIPWPLYLFGEAGSGKTCAALCLIDYAGGQYFTVAELCATVIQSQQGKLPNLAPHGPEMVYPEHFWSRVRQEPLLVIDEIGSRERITDAQYEAVKRCIDERACRPLVVISNLHLSDIQKLYDGRIYSRLASGTCLELSGIDRRIMA